MLTSSQHCGLWQKSLTPGMLTKQRPLATHFPPRRHGLQTTWGGAYIKIGAKWKYLRRLWYLWNSRVTTLKKTTCHYVHSPNQTFYDLLLHSSCIFVCIYYLFALYSYLHMLFHSFSSRVLVSTHTQESSAGMFSALIMCNSDLCGEPATLINWNHMTSNALSGHGQLAMLLP